MSADGTIKIDTKLDSSTFKSGLKQMEDIASKANDGMKTLTNTVTAGFTAAAGAVSAAGTAVVKFGSEFESSLAKASTLFGDVQVDTDVLTEKILSLSNSTGVAASAIGESLYNALSAGIPATEDMGDAMAYMESCAKIAKAGFTDVDTAVTATAKILNAYKMDVSNVDKVHKILMQTQNNGITTVGELGASLAQVTPTAAAMGVTFEQVGAGLATMTAAGTPTAQATTQLNALFAELGKNGTIGQKGLAAATEGTKYAGKSFQDLMGAGVPLNEVLDLMSTYADKNDQSMLDMFSSIEAGKAALAMSGQNAEAFTNNLAAMSTEADVVGVAYEKVSNTFEVNSQKIGNSLKNLGIAMYQDVDTPLADITATAADMVQQLTDAYSEGGFDGLLESVGDVLSQVVTKVAEAAPKIVELGVGLISSLVDGLSKNSGSIIKAAQSAMSSFFGGIRSVMGQIGPLAGEIVSLILEGFIGYYGLVWTAGVELVTQLITGIAKKAPDLIKSAQSAITNIVNGLKKNLPAILKAGIEIITQLIKGISQMLPNLFKTVVKTILNLAETILDNMDAIIDAVMDCIVAIADALLEALPVLLEKLPVILEKLIGGLVSGLLGNLDKIIEAGVKIIATLGEALLNPAHLAEIAIGVVKGLVTGIIDGIYSLASSIADAMIDSCNSTKAYDEMMASIKERTEENRVKTQELKSAFVEAFSQGAEYAADFRDGISSAKDMMSGFNDEFIMSKEKQQELSQKMSDVQSEITNIARTAKEERRGYTDEEIQRLEDLFKQMQKVADQQLALQQARQEAATEMARQALESYQGDLEGYKTYCQDYLNTAQKQRDDVLSCAQEKYTTALAYAQQAFDDENGITKEQYDAAVQAAKESYDLAVSSANKEYSEVVKICQQGYSSKSDALQSYLKKLDEYNVEDQKITDKYNEARKKVEDLAQQAITEAKKKGFSDRLAQEMANNAKKSQLAELEIAEQAEHNKVLEKAAKDHSDKTVSAQEELFLQLVAEAEMYGADIDEETKKQVDKILDHYNGLEGDAKEAFANAGKGMISGLKEQEPLLFERASNIAGGVLSRLKKMFDINSPSRKTRKIFKQVVEGGEVGLEEEAPALIKQTERLASQVNSTLLNIDADLYATRLRKSVALDTAHTTAGVSNTVNYYNTSSVNESNTQSTGALVNIERVEINNDTDAEALGNELGFIISREDAFR